MSNLREMVVRDIDNLKKALSRQELQIEQLDQQRQQLILQHSQLRNAINEKEAAIAEYDAAPPVKLLDTEIVEKALAGAEAEVVEQS